MAKKLCLSELTNKIFLANINKNGLATGDKEDVTEWAINLVGSHIKQAGHSYKLNFDDGDYVFKLEKLEKE